MDIREAVRKNLETAKTALERDRHLANMILLVKGGSVLPLPMMGFEGVPAGESKSRNALAAGLLARKLGAEMVVMVWDAAMRTMPKGTDIDEVDETEMPLSYPKSMRTECVVVHGIDLRDGGKHVEIAPYKGGDGEPVEFLELDKNLEGAPMDTRFDELILEGYESSSPIG